VRHSTSAFGNAWTFSGVRKEDLSPMERKIAERVAGCLLACSGKLDRSVALTQGRVDQAAYTKYRGFVGQIMGMFYLEVLRGVFEEHPDLEPGSIGYVPPDQPMPEAEGPTWLVRDVENALTQLKEDLVGSDGGGMDAFVSAVDEGVAMTRKLRESLEPQEAP
jgi:hypothetical protein